MAAGEAGWSGVGGTPASWAGRRTLLLGLWTLPALQPFLLLLVTMSRCLWEIDFPHTSILRLFGLSRAPPLLHSSRVRPHLASLIGSWLTILPSWFDWTEFWELPGKDSVFLNLNLGR